MNSIQKAWIAIGVGVALAAGLLIWQAKYNKSRSDITSMSKDDVATLVKDFPPQTLKQLSESKERRADILKQLKEILSLAAEAKAMGLDKDPATKKQLELARTIALAQAYSAKQAEGGGQNKGITKEETDAYLKKPGVEEKFKAFLAEAQKEGQIPAGEMQEAQLTQLKDQWAKIYLGEERAKLAGLENDHKVNLQIAIQEALTLARKYNEQYAEKNKDAFTATDAEVEKWISEHPELAPTAKRAKAEDLLKRARSGEDFAKLANENTEDPGNKDEEGKPKGGFYEFGRGVMDKSFEEASFALQPGQISDIVETPYGYHIIKLESKEKKKDKDGKEEEQVKVRHILISTMVKDPTNPTGRGDLPIKEKAKQEVEKAKREQFIDSIAKKHNISLPDDFAVTAPEMPAQPQMPPGMQSPHGGEEQPMPQQETEPEPKKEDGKKPAEKSTEKPKSPPKKGK